MTKVGWLLVAQQYYAIQIRTHFLQVIKYLLRNKLAKHFIMKPLNIPIVITTMTAILPLMEETISWRQRTISCSIVPLGYLSTNCNWN